ncbi:hypothetical protein BDP27DRAFT_1188353, partial [Rhodocollybia butyracea]
ASIELTKLISLIIISTKLKHNILKLYPSSQPFDDVPPLLPLETRKFLAMSCCMSESKVEACWTAVNEIVWKDDIALQRVLKAELMEDTFRQNRGLIYR